jgi:hypothetical protein
VPEHERFEELCAAASIGQVSGPELADLRDHIGWCSECQERYSEFLQLNAAQYAKNARDHELTSHEAVTSIDSALLRQRFLEKAQAEGIVFAGNKVAADLPEPQIRIHDGSWKWPLVVARIAAALSILSVVATGAYNLGSRGVSPSHLLTSKTASPRASTTDQARESAMAALGREKRELTSEMSILKNSLGAQSSKLSALELGSSAAERDHTLLLARAREREDMIASVQTRLDQAQTTIANLRTDLDKAQATASGERAALVEDQVRIRDLSDQLAEKSSTLARERDMLSVGRDIRELMASRNLHIVDVFDTDPKGKTRPAFGRIFFTEGKSLLFYAYDMPDTRLKNAAYHYRVWGKKEGPSQPARSLGIFYSDDTSQKRWVFQSDDPTVLNEIDSVFVTLEPPNSNSTQPKGDKLMYAYLRGQPNHP